MCLAGRLVGKRKNHSALHEHYDCDEYSTSFILLLLASSSFLLAQMMEEQRLVVAVVVVAVVVVVSLSPSAGTKADRERRTFHETHSGWLAGWPLQPSNSLFQSAHRWWPLIWQSECKLCQVRVEMIVDVLARGLNLISSVRWHGDKSTCGAHATSRRPAPPKLTATFAPGIDARRRLALSRPLPLPGACRPGPKLARKEKRQVKSREPKMELRRSSRRNQSDDLLETRRSLIAKHTQFASDLDKPVA